MIIENNDLKLTHAGKVYRIDDLEFIEDKIN
jgi:hypothetical protein